MRVGGFRFWVVGLLGVAVHKRTDPKPTTNNLKPTHPNQTTKQLNN